MFKERNATFDTFFFKENIILEENIQYCEKYFYH